MILPLLSCKLSQKKKKTQNKKTDTSSSCPAFAEKPIFKELSPTQKDYVQQRLSTSLPLYMTAGLVAEGAYWERCCRERWDLCDVSEYDHNWRRMYLERHMESMIELYIPQVTDAKVVLDLVPLCKNDIKKLDISQLLTPIKENQEEEQDKLSLVLKTQSDKPCMDRFNFNTILHHLTCLEELYLMYRVKQCGMNFEWTMFEMTDTDCENLGKAIKSCRTLKVNVFNVLSYSIIFYLSCSII